MHSIQTKYPVNIRPVPWLPLRVGAITVDHTVYMLHQHVQNGPLINHETNHVAQSENEKTVWHFWCKYLFSRKHRFNYEAESFAVEVKSGGDLEQCAYLFSKNYFLNITLEEARQGILAALAAQEKMAA